jgi:hypothetical protein
MPEQSYAKHAQFVPMFHFVLSTLIFLTFIGSLVNLYQSLGDHARIYSASLLVVLSICVFMLFFFIRAFATKLQDRTIRAEENFRCYRLTGKMLDPKITVGQIIALRFAPDDEFAPLATKAVEGNMTPDAIKRAVKNWRPDYQRV